jgi:hypothetical protein
MRVDPAYKHPDPCCHRPKTVESTLSSMQHHRGFYTSVNSSAFRQKLCETNAAKTHVKSKIFMVNRKPNPNLNAKTPDILCIKIHIIQRGKYEAFDLFPGRKNAHFSHRIQNCDTVLDKFYS